MLDAADPCPRTSVLVRRFVFVGWSPPCRLRDNAAPRFPQWRPASFMGIKVDSSPQSVIGGKGDAGYPTVSPVFLRLAASVSLRNAIPPNAPPWLKYFTRQRRTVARGSFPPVLSASAKSAAEIADFPSRGADPDAKILSL
mgnify:CR=1 FL=1